MLRKIILNIHMYGGLLVSGYLILLGISSLQYCHHFFPNPPPPVKWEAHVSPATFDAAGVRDALGLFGWPSQVKSSTPNDVRFNLNRPGRFYVISATRDGHVSVAETRQTWFMITALHGSGRVPGSRLLSVWGAYTEVSAIFGVLACITGVYLFCATRRDRRAALIVLGVSAVLSVSAMGYLYFHG